MDTGLKDTHKKKPPPNKSAALTKSMNMDIWVVGISDQLFIRGLICVNPKVTGSFGIRLGP